MITDYLSQSVSLERRTGSSTYGESTFAAATPSPLGCSR